VIILEGGSVKRQDYNRRINEIVAELSDNHGEGSKHYPAAAFRVNSVTLVAVIFLIAT
jgi:hypothetical protein